MSGLNSPGAPTTADARSFAGEPRLRRVSASGTHV